jgi:MFS family permease
VDTFAINKEKSAWMAFLLLSPPLGVILGYSLTGFLAYRFSWQMAFYVQAVIFVAITLITMLVPGKYINIDVALHAIGLEKRKRLQEGQSPGTGSTNQMPHDAKQADSHHNSSLVTQ